MIYKYILTLFIVFENYYIKAQALIPMNFKDIYIEGELKNRVQKNYNRLETDIFRPEMIFLLKNGDTPNEWPGDVEGRIILGLVLEAQATHREPKYLKEMIDLIPKRVNSEGYFGPLEKDTILEQQLSGNGWFLRGLCEYYIWKRDPKVKRYIENIINNLALPTRGFHKSYPLNPESRKQNVGAASGTTQATVGKWKLSSDIGCDFIFLDGIVQAYEIIPSVELKNLIDEMISRFLQMDLIAIKSQTHATLTGVRAILRYYSIIKNPNLLKEAKKRYDLYRLDAMTANFENFNWFGRPEWTEPCAIIDSYMVAVQLWQFTKDPHYLEDAQHIYYNAISNTQRANGGFGLSNCIVPGNNTLRVNINEAWWCCTMRGGEGLASATRYSYFSKDNLLVIPFFSDGVAKIRLKNTTITLNQKTGYPFKGIVSFDVTNAIVSTLVSFELAAPCWTTKHKLYINGIATSYSKIKGFLVFSTKISKGTKISLTFDMETQISPMVNKAYSKPDYYTISYGPLLLGFDTRKNPEISFSSKPVISRLSAKRWMVQGRDVTLSPVYHLLDSNVNKESGYAKQVLFKITRKN